MTGTRFLHRMFKPCRRTRRPSREDTYENYFDFFALPAGCDIYGLWAEWISQLHPPAAPGESARDSVSCLRQRVAFCRILLRHSIAGWAAVPFGLLRATCADSVGGGALQHPCVSPDACAGEHCSGSGGLCAVGTGLRSVSRKLQGHLQGEARDAVMNWVVASFASTRSVSNRLKLPGPWRPAFRSGVYNRFPVARAKRGAGGGTLTRIERLGRSVPRRM